MAASVPLSRLMSTRAGVRGDDEGMAIKAALFRDLGGDLGAQDVEVARLGRRWSSK